MKIGTKFDNVIAILKTNRIFLLCRLGCSNGLKILNNMPFNNNTAK